MTDISMGNKWVNKGTGYWVGVVATLRSGGIERVRISDSNGPQGRSREIEVDRDWFLKNFTEAIEQDEPYIGETWTMMDFHRPVVIKAVTEGLVVYEARGELAVVRLDEFMAEAQRGKIVPPIPQTDHTGYESMVFPITRLEDGTDALSFNSCRWESEMAGRGRPWSYGTAMFGAVRVPLAWGQAEFVPYED